MPSKEHNQKGALVIGAGCGTCVAECTMDAITWTQKRVEKLWDKMEKPGIRPERLQLEWISAAEGRKFAKVMREPEEMRKQVTVEEVRAMMKILEDERQKEMAKMEKRLAGLQTMATV